MKYVIALNYTATYTATVEGNDDGEALEAARNLAEEADPNEFTFGNEMPATILSKQ